VAQLWEQRSLLNPHPPSPPPFASRTLISTSLPTNRAKPTLCARPPPAFACPLTHPVALPPVVLFQGLPTGSFSPPPIFFLVCVFPPPFRLHYFHCPPTLWPPPFFWCWVFLRPLVPLPLLHVASTVFCAFFPPCPLPLLRSLPEAPWAPKRPNTAPPTTQKPHYATQDHHAAPQQICPKKRPTPTKRSKYSQHLFTLSIQRPPPKPTPINAPLASCEAAPSALLGNYFLFELSFS